MTSKIIDIQGLHFTYGTQPVLSNVNLSVYSGTIFGLAGHNGAGKTTLIKILVTLLTNYTGNVEIFGLDLRTSRLEILRNVGSLVESPGLYLHLTGNENMLLRSILLQVPRKNIETTLRRVGMFEVRNVLVGKYSHGMKQRLGLALAMLQDPQLLILDEPINGLDPNGIKEFRHLARNLAEEGKTILLSSHFLTELEKTADDIAIIDNGKILFSGSIEAIQDKGATNVQWWTNNPTACAEWLSTNGFKYCSKASNNIQADKMSIKEIAGMNAWLVGQGVEVYSIRQQKGNLEQTFFELTSVT